MTRNEDTPLSYAYRATIRETGALVGVYYVPAGVPSTKRRGKAYHLAFLDLRETRFPAATYHADIPNLSVTRAPTLDDYA